MVHKAHDKRAEAERRKYVQGGREGRAGLFCAKRKQHQHPQTHPQMIHISVPEAVSKKHFRAHRNKLKEPPEPFRDVQGQTDKESNILLGDHSCAKVTNKWFFRFALNTRPPWNTTASTAQSFCGPPLRRIVKACGMIWYSRLSLPPI